MSRGIKRRKLIYADRTKQAKIDKNWEHVFRTGDECWIVRDDKQVFGPLKFTYYTECGALAWWPNDVQHRCFRAEFVRKNDVLYRYEGEAKSALMTAKLFALIDLRAKVSLLEQDILALGGDSICPVLEALKEG